MYKLFDLECGACGWAEEALLERDDVLVCFQCGQTMARVPFTQGTAARAQVNPSKTREMFAKAQEMRNKVQGRTPWRRSSYSQTGNE